MSRGWRITGGIGAWLVAVVGLLAAGGSGAGRVVGVVAAVLAMGWPVSEAVRKRREGRLRVWLGWTVLATVASVVGFGAVVGATAAGYSTWSASRPPTGGWEALVILPVAGLVAVAVAYVAAFGVARVGLRRRPDWTGSAHPVAIAALVIPTALFVVLAVAATSLDVPSRGASDTDTVTVTGVLDGFWHFEAQCAYLVAQEDRWSLSVRDTGYRLDIREEEGPQVYLNDPEGHRAATKGDVLTVTGVEERLPPGNPCGAPRLLRATSVDPG